MKYQMTIGIIATLLTGTVHASVSENFDHADLAQISQNECRSRKMTDFSHPGGRNRFTLSCQSENLCLSRCVAESPTGLPIKDVRLYMQTSEERCREGVSWGHQGVGGTIWVDHGCAGIFEAFTY